MPFPIFFFKTTSFLPEKKSKRKEDLEGGMRERADYSSINSRALWWTPSLNYVGKRDRGLTENTRF